MDAFTHLSVLISIILGLAITHVLQGLRSLIHNRKELTSYWPVVVWSLLLLLMYTQTWWVMFGLRERTDWTFGQFAILLAQTTLQYLMAALILPDVPVGKSLDLRRHYFDQKRWFFATAIAATFASLAKDVVLNGSIPATGNVVAHGIFVTTCLFALFTRSDWYHKALSVVTMAGFAGYIVVLFNTLQ